MVLANQDLLDHELEKLQSHFKNNKHPDFQEFEPVEQRKYMEMLRKSEHGYTANKRPPGEPINFGAVCEGLNNDRSYHLLPCHESEYDGLNLTKHLQAIARYGYVVACAFGIGSEFQLFDVNYEYLVEERTGNHRRAFDFLTCYMFTCHSFLFRSSTFDAITAVFLAASR